MPGEIKFGTDGWRGLIADDFTFSNVRICAQAVAEYVKGRGLGGRGVVVGYDTRFLSERFADDVAGVLAENGIRAYLSISPVPTPVASYAVMDKEAAGAVVITASHNPAEWNGFKFKPEYAGSATPEITATLESIIADIQERGGVPKPNAEETNANCLIETVDLVPAYERHIATLVDLDRIRESGLGVAVDSMYGAGIGYVKRIVAGGSARVSEIHRTRNPLFPGLGQPEPIARNLAKLRVQVRKTGADVGLATDGDADRVGVADEHGNILTPLQIFGLLAYYLLEVRGERGPMIKSITTTRMIDRLGERYGVPVYETAVGFKHIGPRMMAEDALIGGEESGGFGFRGHVPERDGILASLYILDLLAQTRRTVSHLIEDLYNLVGPHHYDRVDIPISGIAKEQAKDRIADAQPDSIAGMPVSRLDRTDGSRFEFEDGSWLLFRFSGTEPLMRIYAESRSMEAVDRLLNAGQALASA